MPFANVNGTALYFETHGAGVPLILIPGEGMGAWSWFRQIPAIRQLAQLVVFDPRGVGQSQHSHGQPSYGSVPAMAHDVVGLMQSLPVASANVVGADLGAFVALQLALDRPELVDRLVLIAGAASGRPESFLSDEALRLRDEISEEDPTSRCRHELGLQVAAGFTGRNPGLLDKVVEMRRADALSEETLASQRAAAAQWSPGQALASVMLPTLLIAGSEDRFQRPGTAEDLAARLPRARIEYVPQCGHLPHIERAGIVNRLIMTFVQEHSDPAAGALRWRTGRDGRVVEPGEGWELVDGRTDQPKDDEPAQPPARRFVPPPRRLER